MSTAVVTAMALFQKIPFRKNPYIVFYVIINSFDWPTVAEVILCNAVYGTFRWNRLNEFLDSFSHGSL